MKHDDTYDMTATYAKQMLDLSAYFDKMVTEGIEGDLKSYLHDMITEDMTDEQRETIKMLIESPNIVEDVKLFFDYEISRDGYLSQRVFNNTRQFGKSQMFHEMYGSNQKLYGFDVGTYIADDFVGETKPAKPEPEWKHRLPHEQDRSGAVPDPVRRKLLRSKRTKSKRLR
jgi:hypothetical protein